MQRRIHRDPHRYQSQERRALEREPKDEVEVSEGIEALIENEEWDELSSLMERISEVIDQSKPQEEG